MRLTKALKSAPQNPELFKDYGTAFSQFMNRSARGASRASMPSRYVVDNYMRSWQNMAPFVSPSSGKSISMGNALRKFIGS